MTKTNTFWKHLQRAIPETCGLSDIWSEWWWELTWPTMTLTMTKTFKKQMHTIVRLKHYLKIYNNTFCKKRIFCIFGKYFTKSWQFLKPQKQSATWGLNSWHWCHWNFAIVFSSVDQIWSKLKTTWIGHQHIFTNQLCHCLLVGRSKFGFNWKPLGSDISISSPTNYM